MVPLAVAHASGLHAAYSSGSDRDWTYMPYECPGTIAETQAWIESLIAGDCFFAIEDKSSGAPLGIASYIRIDPGNGTIEVAHINFAEPLQRTRLGTEAVYLLLAHAFDDLGYRRCEWKCDSLNARSRRAALRYGFSFEGIFRQAVIYKGRNRDTSWYAMIDKDWPVLKRAFETWLAPSNFDAAGRQLSDLGVLTKAALGSL